MWKMGNVLRRPGPVRGSNIGVWQDILPMLVYLSVLTNSVLISFTSEQLAAWLPFLYRAATQEDVDAGIVTAAFDAVDGEADLVLVDGKGKFVVFACFSIEHVVGLAAVLIGVFVPAESYATRKCVILRQGPEFIRNGTNTAVIFVQFGVHFFALLSGCAHCALRAWDRAGSAGSGTSRSSRRRTRTASEARRKCDLEFAPGEQ